MFRIIIMLVLNNVLELSLLPNVKNLTNGFTYTPNELDKWVKLTQHL